MQSSQIILIKILHFEEVLTQSEPVDFESPGINFQVEVPVQKKELDAKKHNILELLLVGYITYHCMIIGSLKLM